MYEAIITSHYSHTRTVSQGPFTICPKWFCVIILLGLYMIIYTYIYLESRACASQSSRKNGLTWAASWIYISSKQQPKQYNSLLRTSLPPFPSEAVWCRRNLKKCTLYYTNYTYITGCMYSTGKLHKHHYQTYQTNTKTHHWRHGFLFSRHL